MRLHNGDKVLFQNKVVVKLLSDARESGKLWTAKVELERADHTLSVAFLKYVEFEDKRVVAGLKAEGGFKMYHPNIALVYDAGEGVIISDHYKGAKLYCVFMEYIDGDDYIEHRKTFSDDSDSNDDEIFRHMLQLVKGARYYTKCYESDPAVHRDLKPDNIMIRKDTKDLVIVDFDWVHNHNSSFTIHQAKEMEKDRKIEYAIYGTCGYSDPRLFRSWKTDVKMDIYSVGRIFYYMLAGKHYFNEDELEKYISLAKEGNEGNPLLYSLYEDRIPPRYREEKYALLIRTIKDMVAPADRRMDDFDMVLFNMEQFLKLYYEDNAKQWQSLLHEEHILDESSCDDLQPVDEKMLRVTVSNLTGTNSANLRIRNYQVKDLTAEWKIGICLCNIEGKMKYLVLDKKNMVLSKQEMCGTKHLDTWEYGECKIRIRY